MKLKQVVILTLLCCTMGAADAALVTPVSDLPDLYSTLKNQSGSSLVTTLHALCNTNYKGVIYGSNTCTNCVWGAFKKTDVYPADSVDKAGKIWDIYSTCTYTFQDDQGSGASEECKGGYNREHSLPKSWFGGSTTIGPGTDLFHIYPTDVYVNSLRSNDPYGIVDEVDKQFNNGSKKGTTMVEGKQVVVFEPRDEFKGDLARGYLYMLMKWNAQDTSFCRYAEGRVIFNDNMTSAGNYGLTTYGLTILMKWHREDPVSQREIDRNNAVQSVQGNRNPFIDYPYLAEYLWGEKKDEKVSLPCLQGSFEDGFQPGVSNGWIEAHAPVYTDYSAEFCDGSIYEDRNFSDLEVAGDYSITYTAHSGGDSVVTLHLSVAPIYYFETYKTIIEGTEATWRQHDLSTYAVGNHILNDRYTTYSSGCDSVYILDLTVKANIQDHVSCYTANQLPKDSIVELYPFKVVYVYGTSSAYYYYIADATGGALIYARYDYGLQVGDSVIGFQGKSSPYNGMPELYPVSAYSDLTIIKNTSVQPVEMNAVPTMDECHMYVRYRNLTMLTTYIGAKTTYYARLANGDTLIMHNKLGLSQSFDTNYRYDMTCLVTVFNKVMQVYPIAFQEVEQTVPIRIHASQWSSDIPLDNGLWVFWETPNGRYGCKQAQPQSNDWWTVDVPVYLGTCALRAMSDYVATYDWDDVVYSEPSDELVGNECLLLHAQSDGKRVLKKADCAAFTSLYTPTNLQVSVQEGLCQFTWSASKGDLFGIRVVDELDQVVMMDTVARNKATYYYHGSHTYSWQVWTMDTGYIALSEPVSGDKFVAQDNPYTITDLHYEMQGYTMQMIWSSDAPYFIVSITNSLDEYIVDDILSDTAIWFKVPGNDAYTIYITPINAEQTYMLAATKTDQLEVTISPLVCQQAYDVAQLMDNNETSADWYSVTGYITQTDSIISHNQQTFWMADEKEGGQIFRAYWANLPQGEVLGVGTLLVLYGQLQHHDTCSEITNGWIEVLTYPSPELPTTLSSGSACPGNPAIRKVLINGHFYIIKGACVYNTLGEKL